MAFEADYTLYMKDGDTTQYMYTYPNESLRGRTVIVNEPEMLAPLVKDGVERAFRLIKKDQTTVSEPTRKRELVKMLGADGDYDLLERLTGTALFENRKLTETYMILAGYSDANNVLISNPNSWNAYLGQIKNFLNPTVGKIRIVDSRNKNWYWRGRVSAAVKDLGNYRAIVTITADVDPYRYERYNSRENWIWADFCFIDGIIRRKDDYILTLQPHDIQMMTIPTKNRIQQPVEIVAKMGSPVNPGTVTIRKYWWTQNENPTTENISHYYELVNGKYKKTTDPDVVEGKPYYIRHGQDVNVTANGIEQTVIVTRPNIYYETYFINNANFAVETIIKYFHDDLVNGGVSRSTSGVRLNAGETKEFYIPGGAEVDSEIQATVSQDWSVVEIRDDSGALLFTDNAMGERNIDGHYHTLMDVPDDGMILYFTNPTSADIIVSMYYQYEGRFVSQRNTVESKKEVGFVIPAGANNITYRCMYTVKSGVIFREYLGNLGNPSTKELYERSGEEGRYKYKKTTDTSFTPGTTYCQRLTDGEITTVSETEWTALALPDAVTVEGSYGVYVYRITENDECSVIIENTSDVPLIIEYRYRGASL